MAISAADWPVRSVFRSFSLPQGGRQVLGTDLKCSESAWALPGPKRIARRRGAAALRDYDLANVRVGSTLDPADQGRASMRFRFQPKSDARGSRRDSSLSDIFLSPQSGEWCSFVEAPPAEGAEIVL
jgi:hypothetical protein